MKRIIGMVLSVIIMLTACITVSFADEQEQNLLSNSGFESELLGANNWKFSGTGGWYNESSVTAQRTSDEKHSGDYSVKMSQATVGQRVSLSSGRTYVLKAFIKADAQTSNPYIGFYDGSAEWPASESNAVKTQAITADTQWKEVSVEFECTKSQDYVICLLSWGTSDTVYFDDISLAEYETEFNGGGVTNGDFSDALSGWIVSGGGIAENVDGMFKLSGENYEAKVNQTVLNLENGVYDLTAYAAVSDISGVCYLYGKTDGHTIASTSVIQSNDAQKIVVPGIIVDNGKCDIGLYSSGSSAVTLDNVSLSKSDETRVPFLKGGEISKLTYVEDMGGRFYRADGSEGDALQIMAENGFNLARIRVLNDPGKGHGDGDYYLPAGYQDEADCLEMARRARDKGMQILFSFAYSDTWSDGATQMIPHEWQKYINQNNLSGETMYKYLEDKVYEYTKDIMQKLIAQGTCPEFVSIGNEMQVGLFFGKYQSASRDLYNNPTNLARFLNAGAKAVRETSPNSKIVLHSDNGGKIYNRNTFVSVLSKVDFDVIGASYYPFYNSDVSADTVVNEFARLINQFDKDVIIMETGYNWNETKPNGWDGQLENSGYYTDIYGETQNGQRAFLTELYAKLKQVLGGRCIGDLYWDPVMIYDGGTGKIGWAIDEANDKTQENVVPNSTIFDFDGKAVEGQKAMKYNTNADDKINITGKVRRGEMAAQETKITVSVNGSKYTVTTDKFGEYIVSVPYPADNAFSVSAKNSSNEYSLTVPEDRVLIEDIDFVLEDKADDNYISDIDGSFDSDGVLHFEVNYTAASRDAIVYVGVYDSNGRLAGCAANNSGEFTNVTEAGEYTLKAFLWNEKVTPLCASEEKTLLLKK